MASNKKVQFGGTHVRAYDHGEQGLSLAVENFTAVSAPSWNARKSIRPRRTGAIAGGGELHGSKRAEQW